jgi:hypothetical protein
MTSHDLAQKRKDLLGSYDGTGLAWCHEHSRLADEAVAGADADLNIRLR